MKIVFLGDSVTEGCFDLYAKNGSFDTYREPENVYHTQLLPMLEEKYGKGSIEIVNSGISGDNSAGGCKRLDTDVIAHHPDLTVVCYGLNDASRPLERYQENLTEILSRIKASGSRVIFMTPNMMNTYVSPDTLPEAAHIAERTAQIQNNGTMDAFMDAARAICRELDIPVCDAYQYWKELAASGVDTTARLANHINHPDAGMHTVFAQLLAAMI